MTDIRLPRSPFCPLAFISPHPRSRFSCRAASATKSLRGGASLALAVRVVCLAPHAPAPFGIKMAHAAFVMDGHVLFATVQHPGRLAARMHRAALAMHAQQIFVQITTERAPNHVVIAYPFR